MAILWLYKTNNKNNIDVYNKKGQKGPLRIRRDGRFRQPI